MYTREGNSGSHEPPPYRNESPPYRNESPPYRIEPPWPPYSTWASVIQPEFIKTLVYVFKKIFLEFFSMQWKNSFTRDYNYLRIVMNIAFTAT